MLLAIQLVGLALLTGRLVQVQVVNAEAYQALGDAQSQRIVDLPAQRGRIYDRAGSVLATTVGAAAIYVDPSVFEAFEQDDRIDVVAGEMSREQVATSLAPLLDMPVAELVTRMRGDDQFSYLARQLDWNVGEQVMELGLPGIHRLTEPLRRYPNGEAVAPLLGFTDVDGVGIEGLEQYYNSLLTGEPGQLQVERAPGSLDIASSDRSLQPSVPGTDLVLTIDREIQAEAYRVAVATVAEQNAIGASVIVFDAETAEVLAAVSAPGFDPSHRDGTTRNDRRARPFTDAVEPGSVQKAITIASAWEAGLIDEDTILDVPATWTVAGKTWESHSGAQSMGIEEILERSSNIGTMMVADMLGDQQLDAWLRRFGYGVPTDVGFPGESAGLLSPVDLWSATSLPTIAIGHGVAVSTIQLASFYQVLANDGVRVQPSILRGTVGADGQLEPGDQPETTEVISADTARVVRTMLTSVVEGEFGTGRLAAVDGYHVAGKTGTAAKPLADGRGYSNETTAVFAGMAPVDDPELVVVVMVDEPDAVYGGAAAAPAFSQIMSYALAERDVAPTALQPTLDEAIETAQREAAQVRAEARAIQQAAQERAVTTAALAGTVGAGPPGGVDQTPNG